MLGKISDNETLKKKHEWKIESRFDPHKLSKNIYVSFTAENVSS
jgi:hypothetical protein